MSDMHTELETRLTRYCAIDSQSDAASRSAPSTQIQLDMARLLVQELTEIGAADITLKIGNGRAVHIKSNRPRRCRTIRGSEA